MPSEVIIIDTSVFLNVLDVPDRNQDRDEIRKHFEALGNTTTYYLLPLAAVLETGNHIARLSDGRKRRQYAKKLRDEVTEALAGNTPWKPIQFPDSGEVSTWLHKFPEFAVREIGLSDLSIINAWEAARTLYRNLRVRIWSLDQHLQGYDHTPG